jgi:hypothetical protein
MYHEILILIIVIILYYYSSKQFFTPVLEQFFDLIFIPICYINIIMVDFVTVNR